MPEIPTLEIDMDKECGRCGEKGAAPNGLCLKCVAGGLKKARFTAIGPVTIEKVALEITAMLHEYREEIDQSYVKADGDLTVALGLKMAGTRMSGEVAITVSINFVESRIKHKVEVIVNEKQMSIPGV